MHLCGACLWINNCGVEITRYDSSSVLTSRLTTSILSIPSVLPDVRLADGVSGDQQLLRERVPLLEVLDLLLREIQGRVRLLEHVLQALVRRLAGLEMEFADDLILHLGGELPEGRRGDVKVLRTQLLDERTQLILGSHTWSHVSGTTDRVTSATRFSRLTLGS